MRILKPSLFTGIIAGLLLCPTWVPAVRPQPAGRLVDLGGHRLHVYCSGKGSPAAVVEAGLGDFSFDWVLVQARVSQFTRICTYDRAGYGFSDPGPKPRTLAQINLELHDALRSLGERGPFVLVGHSFGGPVVRNYDAAYPQEVAGMLLVDTVAEDQRIPMGDKARRVRDLATGKAIPLPHEAMLDSDRPHLDGRETGEGPLKLDPPFDRLPPREQHWQSWASAQPALEDAENSEREWSPEYMLMMYNTPQTGILGSLPLIVLTRAKGGYGSNLDVPSGELEQERLETQARLAKLSNRGKQIIVPGGHNMEIEAPDLVTSAIRQIVAEVRNGRVH
jgi:pimeloyl-ACP methyl ester carboxylesterase